MKIISSSPEHEVRHAACPNCDFPLRIRNHTLAGMSWRDFSGQLIDTCPRCRAPLPLERRAA